MRTIRGSSFGLSLEDDPYRPFHTLVVLGLELQLDRSSYFIHLELMTTSCYCQH